MNHMVTRLAAGTLAAASVTVFAQETGPVVHGKTLYVTARTSLYRIRLNVAGVRP